MYKGNSSRVIPIIIVIIVVAIAIAALVSLGRSVFMGGESKGDIVVDTSRDSLLDTSLGHSVQMTVRGEIVADENFRSYQVTISPTSRMLQVFSGYLDSSEKVKSYGNNTKAYEELVYALDKADMLHGRPLIGDDDDIRGVCATGNVYEFDVLEDNKSVKHLWTSTCKGSKGSFRASVKQVQNLFLEQIPESSSILRKVDL